MFTAGETRYILRNLQTVSRTRDVASRFLYDEMSGFYFLQALARTGTIDFWLKWRSGIKRQKVEPVLG
jgi:hypothetical protein